jgi:histone H3/H4
MGHKSSYAEEERAPTTSNEDRPKRRIIASSSTNKKASTSSGSLSEKEVLIVVSKLKSYVKNSADMNTSADVADVLSDYVRLLVDQAKDNARSQGRKTLMGRDFHNLSL